MNASSAFGSSTQTPAAFMSNFSTNQPGNTTTGWTNRLNRDSAKKLYSQRPAPALEQVLERLAHHRLAVRAA
ncbi:MAG: hypothetical protein MUF32_06950, partial [Burkholderiaceae bacterium]|nr:hypothetical protein [Burkholderiaceae bacterium]